MWMSHTDGGLSTVISSAVEAGITAGQGPEGILSCCGVVLPWGKWLMIDRF